VEEPEGEKRPVIEYSRQPMPRRGISFWGLASCAVVIVSALLFFRNWSFFHRIPVNRSIENLTVYSSAIETLTRDFWGMALFGLTLGAIGLWQGRKGRLLAWAGLTLNLGTMAVLMALQSTGGP
jgi:hypothetical protein